MKNSSDIFTEWLVLGCQQGDRKSFELLVKHWQPKVLSQAYWYCKSSMAAKDITQEAWASVIKGLSNLKNPARFPVWLHQIVHRKSVDWIRKMQKERGLDHHEVEESLHSETEGINDKSKLLMKHLQNLPEEQIAILTLFYLKEHSILEIGEILSIPSGTVKSRLFNAREHLKKKLKNIDYEKS